MRNASAARSASSFIVRNTSLTSRIALFDLASRFEAVQQRHRDVEHDEIRLVALRRRDQRPPVGHLADDLALAGQQLLERAEQQRVVVGEQDSRRGHGCYSSAVTWAACRCPRPVREHGEPRTTGASRPTAWLCESARWIQTRGRIRVLCRRQAAAQTSSRVPPPRCEWISSVPPIASRRSLMLTRPSPCPRRHRHRTRCRRRRWIT